MRMAQVSDFERVGARQPEWLMKGIPRLAEHRGVSLTMAGAALLAECELLWDLKRENQRDLTRSAVGLKALRKLFSFGKLMDGEVMLVVGDNFMYRNNEYFKERGLDPKRKPSVSLHIAEDEIGDTYERLGRGKLAATVGRPNDYGELVTSDPFDAQDYDVVRGCIERILFEKHAARLSPCLSSDLNYIFVPWKFVYEPDYVHTAPLDYTGVAA